MAGIFSLPMPHLASLADQEVELGRLSTRWRISGSGRAGTVLMLHSLGLDRLAFDPLRAVLRDDWRVVSFDQYAHGAAAAQTDFRLDDCVDAVLAAVALCGEAPVHLVGHSMGGAIAAHACTRAGGRIATLALVATPPAGGPAFSGRGDLARQGGMGAMIGPTLERWFGSGAAAMQAGEAQAYARGTLQAMRSEGFARGWDELAAFRGYWSLAQHLPPTLCIAAADDASTPPHLMMQIVQACAPAEVPLRIVAGTGHMVPITRPDAVAPLLEAHWTASH